LNIDELKTDIEINEQEEFKEKEVNIVCLFGSTKSGITATANTIAGTDNSF